MGKKTQFSRAKVAPIVAEIAAGTFSDVSRKILLPKDRLKELVLT